MSACTERIATAGDEDDGEFVAVDELEALFERANKLEEVTIKPTPSAEASSHTHSVFAWDSGVGSDKLIAFTGGEDRWRARRWGVRARGGA